MAKRVVLEHTKPPFTGLYQILGFLEDGIEVPNYICDVDFLDHRGSCKLIGSKDHYHLYREVDS